MSYRTRLFLFNREILQYCVQGTCNTLLHISYHSYLFIIYEIRVKLEREKAYMYWTYTNKAPYIAQHKIMSAERK